MGLSRQEAWSRWGLIREIEPLTQAAYDFYERLEAEKPNIGDAADTEWHLSFHGSSFPGDNPYACGRRALYTMMDIPRGGMTRRLRGQSEAGKDIEDRIVTKYYLAGYLLSAPPPPYGKYQTVFEDKDHWLTSTVDAIVVHPNQDRGKVVEIKSKDQDVIEQMKKLCRGPDEKHILQLKCQIGLAHEQGSWKVRRCYNSGRLAIQLGSLNGKKPLVCPEHGGNKCLREEVLEPVEKGFLKYVSRNDPNETWEFMYEYDPDFMEAGRRKLREWIKNWEVGLLPQTEFSDKRFSHPFGWYWSKPEYPCKYCDYGEICRSDHRRAVEAGNPITLGDSEAIGLASEIRNGYELNKVREAVETRWNKRRTA
jgi:hypothetical protein